MGVKIEISNTWTSHYTVNYLQTGLKFLLEQYPIISNLP